MREDGGKGSNEREKKKEEWVLDDGRMMKDGGDGKGRKRVRE